MKNLLIVIGAAILVVMLSGCPAPKVIVEGINGSDTFGLMQGCYSTVSGQVKNTGNATAEDVSVACSTTQEGTIIGTNNKNLGSLSAGSSVPFSMDVDTDCFKGDVSYGCTASCSDC